MSGTWQSNPGPSLAANYVASNAVIAAGPQPLGRDLSGGAANVTVNLIAAGARSLPLGGTTSTSASRRSSGTAGRGPRSGFDIYNLTNTDVVTSYNQTFVPVRRWLTPTGIQPARYLKVSAQFDF